MAGGVVAGFGFGVGRVAEFADVFAGVTGFGDGVFAGVDAGVAAGLEAALTDGAVGTLLAGVCVFAIGTGDAAGTSPDIDPLDQIWARLSLFISNSIVLRFGARGWAGRVIDLPFITRATTFASDFE